MARTNPARRAALTDAAIRLLASEGVHGLTHRAVDQASGLPSGTTANYFGSREELLVAAAERAVSLHLEAMGRIDGAGRASPQPLALVELVAASLEDAVTTSRERYVALFELRLEARRRPAIAEALARLESVATAFTAHEHQELGLEIPPEAIPTLMTLYGGALFALVTGPDVDRDAIGRIARALVCGALAESA